MAVRYSAAEPEKLFSLHFSVSSPVNALCSMADLRISTPSTTSCAFSLASSSFAKMLSIRSTIRCCSSSGGSGKLMFFSLVELTPGCAIPEDNPDICFQYVSDWRNLYTNEILIL